MQSANNIQSLTEKTQGRLALALSPQGDRQDIPGDQVVLACEDNLSFLGQLPDDQMKLVVTSPPYNLGKDYESRTSFDTYLELQEEVIAECVRVLHSQGSICWQVGNYVNNGEIVPLDAVLYPVFRKLGLKLRNRIVWHFGHGLHSSRRLSGRYETINWWTKNDCYTWNLDPIRVPSKYPGKRHFKGPNAGKLSGNPKGKNPSDVWDFPQCQIQSPRKDDPSVSIPGGVGGTSCSVHDQFGRSRFRSLYGGRVVNCCCIEARSGCLWMRYRSRVRQYCLATSPTTVRGQPANSANGQTYLRPQ